MKSICLINVYFGKFPWYFNLFLKSCEKNTTVDFFIFSNSESEYPLPPNVKIIPFSLEKFNDLSSSKLDFQVSIDRAYKLCDFKPAYGFIFSDYLKDYDFWGMIDIDIIFGRIREFMTDEILDLYDIISTRHDYLTGSFLLFKNTHDINTLFKKSKDYKKVFTSMKNFCFDECNFQHGKLESGHDIFDLNCEIESMEHIIRKEQSQNKLSVFYDFLVIDGLSGKMKWEDGILSYKNEYEALLFHLIQYKSNIYCQKKVDYEILDTFYIDKYIIRFQKLSAFKTFFSFLYFEKIKPAFGKKIYRLDYFLSSYIFKNKALLDLSGLYKNKLGISTLNFIDHSSQSCSVVLVEDVDINFNLYRSTFRKDHLFIRKLPSIKIISHNSRLLEVLTFGEIINYYEKLEY